MMEKIKITIEEALKINLDSPKRNRELVEARVIFCLLVFASKKTKTIELGAFLDKNHTTICHYKKVAVTWVKYDKKFRQKLEDCLQKTGKSKEEIKQILTLDFLNK